MATTNPVNQVLVPTGNQALLAAGNRPDALAVGQLGVFNFHTGLSIDGSVGGDSKDVFLAVGIDPLGTGALVDVNRSAGQLIQARNAKALSFKGYTAGAPKIIDITDFAAYCQTNYQIKVELRNAETYALNGYSQLAKTFNFQTGACATPTATAGDGNELAIGLVANITLLDWLVSAALISSVQTFTVNGAASATGNVTVVIGKSTYAVPVVSADAVGVVATKIAAFVNALDTPQFLTVAGAVVTVNGQVTGSITASGSGVTINTVTPVAKTVITNSATYITNNPGAVLGIRLTSIPSDRRAFDSINVSYMKNRDTDMFVSLIDGFVNNGTATTVQNLAKVEGSGYDLRQLEYIAGGWNGKPGPYRISDTTGMARAGIAYFTSLNVNYNVFVLAYDQHSVGGWLEYDNNLETILAVPCGDATTLAAVATVFDLIFTQFGGMAGDVSANGDCTNVRTGLLTPATDGLESLA